VTGAVVYSKLTLGLLATITLEAVPFSKYAPFPVFLHFLKCILEVALRFCLVHLSCAKIAVFRFYRQSEKQKKLGWVGDDSHVIFGKKFSGEKESVRRCNVMQQPVLLSPKFAAKSSHI
jgi:hypothetical protein